LLALARALAVPPYAALGLLEALLDWTFDYARRGDVGRFDNAAIAAGVGWEGDTEHLITTLVATRWLDRCAEHRLVVHDLAEHAAGSWKRLMTHHRLEFARPTPPSPPVIPESSGIFRNIPECSGSPAPAPAPASTPTPNRVGAEAAPRETVLGFDRFWTAYPKKRHKPAATRAWRGIDGARHLEAIVAGVERWTASDAWRRGFVEDPATFLRQRQWEDATPEDETAAVAAKGEAIRAEARRKLEEGTL